MRGRGGPRELVGAALLGLVAVLLGLAVILGLLPGRASANGTLISIALSYLVGVSTFGPQNASGVAEIVADEGEVRLTASGLAELPGHEHYRLWIVNTTNSDRLSLGAFRAEPIGVGKMDLIHPPFSDRGWDLMLVSVEANAGDPTEPSARRSIAGRFPPPNIAGGVSAAPATSVTPGALPLDWIVAGLAGLLLSGLAGLGLGRAAGRKGPR